MAKVFLDVNYFIDAIVRKPEKQILETLENHTSVISALSIHIYCYTQKIKIPNNKIIAQRELFQVIEMSENILDSALLGPTTDFEDNVQLHSAAEAECDIFLTNDKKLLALKFFGKTRICTNISGD
ncbi:MAG: type II toxin-antitoxin system VapC family toxin [Patescibacteria group bacterium]